MKRAVGLVMTLLVGLLVGFLAGTAWSRRESVTLVCLSPDESCRVRLVEVGIGIDRNFHVRLERLPGGTIWTLFRSPDEGMPVGSERIIWSPDSRRFVLLGLHFFVRDGTPAPGGESLYLLCDVGSGKLWCNGSQSAYPPFDARDADWAAAPNLALQRTTPAAARYATIQRRSGGPVR